MLTLVCPHCDSRWKIIEEEETRDEFARCVGCTEKIVKRIEEKCTETTNSGEIRRLTSLAEQVRSSQR